MWNPNPANSIKFRSDTYALHFTEDQDFPGFHIIVVLSRPSPAVEWNTIQSGTLLSGPWQNAIARAGGWAPWITATVDAANAAIHESLGDSSPIVPISSLPPGTPATWDECVAWLLANLWVADTATSSNIFAGPKPVEPPGPTPAPTPGAGNPGNGWFQFQAGQQDMAFRTFVDADGVQRFAVYRKDGAGRFTWVPPALSHPA